MTNQKKEITIVESQSISKDEHEVITSYQVDEQLDEGTYKLYAVIKDNEGKELARDEEGKEITIKKSEPPQEQTEDVQAEENNEQSVKDLQKDSDENDTTEENESNQGKGEYQAGDF